MPKKHVIPPSAEADGPLAKNPVVSGEICIGAPVGARKASLRASRDSAVAEVTQLREELARVTQERGSARAERDAYQAELAAHNVGRAQHCEHLALAALEALGLEYEETAPVDIVNEVRELRRQRDHYKKLVDEGIEESFRNIPVEIADGSVKFKHWAARWLVESFRDSLGEAENCVEMVMGCPDGTGFLVTIVRRPEGKTPLELRQEGEKERDEAIAQRDLAVEKLKSFLVALEQAKAVLLAWEQWEADIVTDSGCWGGDGMSPYPTITEPHYDALVPDLQEQRNRAKRVVQAALASR
jgi:hypothetical protein